MKSPTTSNRSREAHKKFIFSIIGAILCYLACWKIFFMFFSASETMVIFTITAIVLLAFGIQEIEWTEETNNSFLGFQYKNNIKVYSQYTILGVIPITNKKIIYESSDIMPISGISTFISDVSTLIPLGGIFRGLLSGSKALPK